MKKMTARKKENIYLVLNVFFSVITMVLALSLTGRVVAQENNSISLFLGLSILSLELTQILLFIVHERKRDRIRDIIIGAMYLVASILGFIANNHYVLYFVSNALVVLTMALNQFLLIEKEKTKRGMITNILLGIVLTGLGILILTSIQPEIAPLISIVTVVLLLIGALKRLLFPSLRLEKIKLLIDIIIKTHTFDAIVGLLAFVIAFSFLFPMVEENITNYWDAMWYCFAVITTIGFGDFYATSLIGRILTVVLGIYGIIVVAILTSVVVNFYNEVSAKEKTIDRIE